ncbi:MAG: hypothetical protein FK731_13440 [Asgard group archaeon]|nr:hypothetical protein [Asgard group archaeon]
MSIQKIYGLIVTAQKIPLVEKAEKNDQCYICGFTLGDENYFSIFSDENLTDRRKVHQKCIQNHLQLLPNDTKIALVSVETNEVIAYTHVNEKS